MFISKGRPKWGRSGKKCRNDYMAGAETEGVLQIWADKFTKNYFVK